MSESHGPTTTHDTLTTLGRANQACKRCHTRKKRCDRVLPQCEACRLASVQCSFQDQAEESRIFPITWGASILLHFEWLLIVCSYVRGLEDKVRLLEEQLSLAGSAGSPNTRVDHGLQHVHRRLSSLGGTATSSSPSSVTYTGPIHQEGDSLASELKSLSLEATAERYLGSSSGVSFARLTQAVLRRLKSDQYPFAIEDTSTNNSRRPSESFAPLDTPDPQPDQATESYDLSAVLDQQHALRLTEYYWEHSHTLYPFIRKVAFMDNLRHMYAGPETISQQTQSWLYTMWMVFAIGSTARSAIMLDEESESALYFQYAMQHFDGALSMGATAALSAILLQVSYSFFNKVGPNTWYLVGVGVRIAIGIGLHTPPPANEQIPIDVLEYRKRLFWSLYMMDRVVSISLGRPFGIQDDDVEVDVFLNVDDENITAEAILPQPGLRPSFMTVPLHILKLRRIAGEIFQQVYTNRNRHLPMEQKDQILQNLHQKLIDWRRTMPFPLPQSKSLPIPQLSTAWYDLNYYQHVLMAYRPSPLFPVLTLEKVGLIAEASTMFINQVSLMQRQKRYAFNWLNLFTIFTATLTLIYSITAQPEPIPVYLHRTNALNDLNTVRRLLTKWGGKFPSAFKCRDIVQDVLQRLQSILAQGDPQLALQYQPPEIDEMPTYLASFPADPGSVDPEASNIAYPFIGTGNASYDDLQHRITGYDSPELERSGFNLASPPMLPYISPDAYQFSSMPFGNAAAEYMAAGIGTSTEMDMDEEMLRFIGFTSGNIGR